MHVLDNEFSELLALCLRI